MECDQELKRGGYSVNLYLKVLEQEIPKCFILGRVFIQDNASIHTAKKVQKWCEENAILQLD
jgi:hypothetical protein